MITSIGIRFEFESLVELGLQVVFKVAFLVLVVFSLPSSIWFSFT